MDENVKYTLGKNWILRSDLQYVEKYSARNVFRNESIMLSQSLYLFLKILSNNAFTFSELDLYFSKKKIQFDWNELFNVLKRDSVLDLLVEYKDCEIHERVYNQSAIKGSYVPVATTPLEMEVHFTHKCNLTCKHCFQSSYPKSKKFEVLSPNYWIRFFEDCERNNVYRVILSGGEPLYYKYFTEVMKASVDRRISYTILTNGTLIDESNVDILSRPNVYLTISLDGHTSKLHDLQRGCGAFKKVMNAIFLLQERNAKIHIAHTLNKENMSYLDDFIQFLIMNNLKSVNIGLIEAMGRAAENEALLLTEEEKNKLLSELVVLKKKYQALIKILFLDETALNEDSLNGGHIVNDGRIYCSAGTYRLGVNSDGAIYPCVYAFGSPNMVMGDIQTEDLLSVWQDPLRWHLFRGEIFLEDLEVCSSCALNDNCTLKNCRMRGYVKTGNIYSKPNGCMLDKIN